MKMNYRQEVLVLPGSVLSSLDANEIQLRVLLLLASDLSLAQKPKMLARLAECDTKQARESIDFWVSRGVLAAREEDEPSQCMAVSQGTEAVATEAQKEVRRTVLRRADELPSYTSTEIADLLEQRASLRTLISEAQHIIGKIFNVAEVNILVGMIDHLGIEEEGVLLLLAHCKRIGKDKLRMIEKYAFDLVDRNITTADALNEEFRTVEALRSFEGEIRKMFGMKSRSITAKEEKMLREWVSYGYDVEIVRKAYEITVNATNEASLPYANTILKGWHEEGLHTAEEIDRAVEEGRLKKAGKLSAKKQETTLGNSFETDDFFAAALRRSFSEPNGEG